MSHQLLLTYRGQVLQRYDLTGTAVTIGREDDRDIVIDDEACSRRHAQLSRVGDTYYLEDTGSRNGTYVDGLRLRTRVALKDGDSFEICGRVFILRAAVPLDLAEADDLESTVLMSTDAIPAVQDLVDSNAAGRLRSLLTITEALGRTLDLPTLFDRLLEGLLDVFPQAGRGLVLLCEEDRLVPAGVRARGPEGEAPRFSRTIARRAIEGREAVVSGDLMQDPRFSGAGSVADCPIRSLMCTPLFSLDMKPLGVLQLDTRGAGRAFTGADLDVFVTVAQQASAVLEYAQLHRQIVELNRMRQEMELARHVQRALLPQQVAEPPGYAIKTRYLPARHVAGDFYDVVRLPTGSCVVLLGDVMGKGVPAALLMVRASAACRTALLSHPDDLTAALGVMNREIYETAGSSTFVTLTACEIRPQVHEVVVASAGHMSPIVRRRDGTLEEPVEDHVRGYPLGVVKEASYATLTTRLEPGEYFLVFSDGIPDARNAAGVPLTTARVRQQLESSGTCPAEDIAESLLGLVNDHLQSQPQSDDVSLVVFQRTGPA